MEEPTSPSQEDPDQNSGHITIEDPSKSANPNDHPHGFSAENISSKKPKIEIPTPQETENLEEEKSPNYEIKFSNDKGEGGEGHDSFISDHEGRKASLGSSINLDDLREKDLISTEEMERAIIERCKEEHCLYEDEDFPAAPTSLYNDPDNIPEYDRGMGCETWVRPKDIADNPVLFANGISPGDIQQGSLGDCWFMGSLCCLAIYPKLLERLFVNTEFMLEYGFVTCQFFKNGEWKQVIIDTRIPYNSNYGAPIYAHCKDPNEMWLPLIEKAYAKLHRTYENLNGGKMAEALVDLTGEASEKFNLKDPDTASLLEGDEFWNSLLRYFKQGCLLGCSNSLKEKEGENGEEMGNDGIWSNHAYGIMDVRDIPKPQPLKLIRIRNPWGEGEWKGTFADEDEEWDKHRGLKDELNYEFGKDGTWWMAYDDWKKHFNRLYVCRMFPEKWQKYSIDGKWEGKTAGGPPPIQIDRDEELAQHIKMDSDDKWFNNPQYRVTVKKKTHVFISLMQADQKLSEKPYLPCNFLVIKTIDKKNRIWEKDQDDVVASAAEGLQRFAQREITKDLVLEPPEGKKEAHYIIVPYLEIDGKKLEAETSKKSKGRMFWLRLFSSQSIEVLELPETYEIIEKGEWAEKTAGGRRTLRNGRDNPLWCINPQYFLKVETTTLLKIILRKTGKFRQAKGFTVGMVLCHAPVRANTKKNLNMGTRGKTQVQVADRDIPEYERERKLQILGNEWFIESHYQYDDFSCIYEKLEPHHGPYLIVPSLSQENIQALYSLTIYSNYPVTIERLQDSKNVVLSGEWKKGNSGGCHLYERPYANQLENLTWGNNPKYLLKFSGNNPISAKITLSRPERLWSSKIARKSVGCMMALYLFDGIMTKPQQERWLRKPEFMPLNEIVEILDEPNPSPSGYMLMPTTYESGMNGPFVLSVSSENDFTLTEIVEQVQ